MAKKKNKITLNVQIPRDLHDRFKTFAKVEGEPMRFFVQKAIKELLESINSKDELQKVRAQENGIANL